MVFANIILVFLISMQNGMYSLMISNTLKVFSGHYQLQAEGYHDNPLMHRTLASGVERAESMRQQLGDIVAARTATFALLASEERTYGAQLIGVEVEHEPSVSSLPGLVKAGNYLGDSNAHEIVIGEILARNLKVGIGDELTLLGNGKDGSIAADIVNITGLFATGNNDIDRMLVHMPLPVFQQVFSMRDDVHSIVISADSLAHSRELEQQIQAPADSVLLDWQELEPGLMQAIRADIGSALFVYLVLILLSGFSVLNTVLMTVLERTREFGIFLALGLRPLRLAAMVFIETFLLALLGLLAGALLGAMVALYFEIYGLYIPGYEEVAAQFNMPARMRTDLDWLSLLLGPGFVFITALLATLYPIFKLMQLQPVAAMQRPV